MTKAAPSRDVADLIAIMAALRTPETGCPWDLEQTSASIVPYTLEEAQEVADAVNRDDPIDLCEELGDLLLQVVFHARIAEEAGRFDFGSVVAAITSKLIRRHPHVFGDRRDLSPDEVKDLWHAIKRQEKLERAAARRSAGQPDPASGLLSGVLPTAPALARALKLQVKAATVGFDWTEAGQVLAKVKEEISEIEEAIAERSADAVRGEIGDLLFAVANLARHADGDPEAILQAANDKFQRRFSAMEALSAPNGGLAGLPLDAMEGIWQEVKNREQGSSAEESLLPPASPSPRP